MITIQISWTGLVLASLGLLLLAVACRRWERWGNPVAGWVARRDRRRRARLIETEDTLKVLYNLGGAERPVPVERLAQAIGTSRAVALRIADRMVRRGWGRSSAGGREVRLTEAGRRRALELIRAHRLWERSLADEEGFPLEEVHAEAHRREHETTPEEMEALARRLGYPRRDPHGDLIPDAQGRMEGETGQPLTRWPLDEDALVLHVEDEPPPLFAQLVAMGFVPGVRLRVQARQEERLLVEQGGYLHVLAPEAAERISVVPAPPEPVPLSDLRVGQRGRILALGAVNNQRRMLDMGLVPGALIEVVRTAPLGDPIEYRVKGSSLSLRKDEAREVLVEPLPE